MKFTLSSTQSQLQDSARRMLSDRLTGDAVRAGEGAEEGFVRSVWEEGVQLGWPGVCLPMDVGGSACSVLDTCVLVEEFGRAGATLPFVMSTGVCATMLRHCPASALRDELLSEIAAGRIIVPALIEQHGRNERGRVQLPLVPTDSGFTLSGGKVLVPFASAAREIMVTSVLPDGELAIVVVSTDATGLTVRSHETKVGVPLFSLSFDQVLISSERVLSRGDDAREALEAGLQIGALLSTAEAVGLGEALIDLTSEYVSVRHAFGQPIGAFQAVAHPCADMRISAEAIRLLVHEAAWRLDRGEDASEEIDSTKGLANELFDRLGNDAFRVHGAIAYSNEYDLQLYTRRLQWFCRTMGETQESLLRAGAAHRQRRSA